MTEVQTEQEIDTSGSVTQEDLRDGEDCSTLVKESCPTVQGDITWKTCLARWATSIKVWLVVTFVGIFSVFVLIFFRAHFFELLEWLKGAQLWQTLVVFVALFILFSLPFTFGLFILNIAAGYLYGFWWGQLIVSVSATIGFSVAFPLCRLCMKDWIDRNLVQTSEVAKALVRVVEGKKGFKVMILARFTPIPYGFQNGVLAVTSTTFWLCLAGTLVGSTPTQCLNTYMGSTLRDITQVMNEKEGGILMLIGQIILTILLTLYVIKLARKEFRKLSEEKEQENEKDSPNV